MKVFALAKIRPRPTGECTARRQPYLQRGRLLPFFYIVTACLLLGNACGESAGGQSQPDAQTHAVNVDSIFSNTPANAEVDVLVKDNSDITAAADARIQADDIDGLPPYRPMAGMTIADNFPDYTSAQALELCDTLKSRGVTWVVITPCGSMSSISSRNVVWSDWARRDYVQAIRNMRSHGMRVLLKPYIWSHEFWTKKYWTGDIKFPDSTDRARWFESYTRFMMDNARYARDGGADMLCIALEMPLLTPYADQWRTLIDSIRTVYDGPLTYAAHGTEEAARIQFWDDLEFIGINLYPNLSGERDPSDQTLRNGWEPILQACANISAKHRREILLTEAGFRSVVAAAHKPWEWPEHEARPISMSHQTQAYRVLAQAVYPQEWFSGIFWWKVFTDMSAGGPRDDAFTPQGKPAFDELQRGFADLHVMFADEHRLPLQSVQK